MNPMLEPIDVTELAVQAETKRPRTLHFIRGIYSATTAREILYIEKIRRKYFAGVDLGYPAAINALFAKIKGIYADVDDVTKHEFDNSWIAITKTP